MIRHISVFAFSDAPANGRTKEENIRIVREYLEKVPEQFPAMKNQTVGVSVGSAPALPDDAPVMNGDLVQIADYDTLEDAASYLPSRVHMDLVELSGPMINKVTVIDFEI